MYTLQRRKVKDKLDVLGKQLQQEFQTAGLELVMHLSDDHPSLWNKKQVDTQWLFFSRDVNAQKELSDIIDTEKTLAATLEDPTPLYRHIFLGVSVNEHGLEVGIRLHHDAWVDRKNLLAILADTDKQRQFMQLCQSLPASMGFGLHQNELTAVHNVTTDVLHTFQQEFDTSSKGWMFFGAKMDKTQAIEQGSSAAQTIIAHMNDLVNAYQFIAWSLQNDALSINNIVEQKKQERQATHEELLQAQKEREEKQRQIVEQRQKDNEAKKQELLDEQAWREQERAKRRAAARARREQEAAMAAAGGGTPSTIPSTDNEQNDEADGNRSEPRQQATTNSPRRDSGFRSARGERVERRSSNRSSGESDPRRKERASVKRERRDGSHTPKKNKEQKAKFQSGPPKAAKPIHVSEERKADIQIGDRIVVVSGFLKGRDGIVQSIDEKGDLKVSFGMLSSRVAKADVQGQGPVV